MACKCNPQEIISSIIDEINNGTELGRRLVEALNSAVSVVSDAETTPIAPPTEPEYTNEVRWGSIRALVDLVADTALDLLQLLALRSGGASVLGELIEAIPIIGPALSIGIDALSWAAPLARDAYDAHDSGAAREELACDIFCALRGRDDWDYAQFDDALQAALSLAIPPDLGAIVSALDDLLLGTLPPDLTWRLANATVSSVMRSGGSILGIDVRRARAISNAGLADDDYTNCDCEADCTDYIEIDGANPSPPAGWILRDMAAAEYAAFSSLPLPPQLAWADYGDGTIRLGSDIVSPNYGGASRVIAVRALELPPGLLICRVELSYRTWGNNSIGQLAIWIINEGERTWYEARSSAGVDEQVITYYPDVPADVLCLRLYKLYSGALVGFSRVRVYYRSSP